MGTTCENKPANVKAELMERFTWETDTHINRALDCAIVKFGREAYLATETVNKETGQRWVWGCVVHMSYYMESYYEQWCHKEVTETMGPFAVDCPKRILVLLTPTDNKAANEWREGCRKQLARLKGWEVIDRDGKTLGRPKYGLQSGYRAAQRFALEHGRTHYLKQRDNSGSKILAVAPSGQYAWIKVEDWNRAENQN